MIKWIADRSRLEGFTECPRQERFKQSNRVNERTYALESGGLVHDVMSAVIVEYIASRGAMSVSDIAESITERAAKCRPDLQPDVLRALRPSSWGIAKYLRALHPDNIIRFDGGELDRGGQLAIDFDDIGVRATSEIDMLHSGPSIEVLHELDWKSGHEHWTADGVADSFQFQMHGLLVLRTYQEIKAVNIRIWNTRLKSVTYSVLFRRTDYDQYYERVYSAAKLFAKWQDADPEDTEPWPLIERCRVCPAAALCDASKLPVATPEEMVDRLALVTAHAEALEALLKNHVRATGAEIVTARGNCFGKDKPKQDRAPTMGLYELVKK